MSSNLKENSAVQNHINILQNVINRMAGNSANSKTWPIKGFETFKNKAGERVNV